MKILCIGGGAAGLYFSILMKKQDPSHEITVIERNRPYDTFGWGVVFSDATLSNFVKADEETARTILQSFNHWDDIDVRIKSKSITSGGHGFCGIGRKRLLNILQERAEGLGVKLIFETEVKDDQEIAAEYGGSLRPSPVPNCRQWRPPARACQRTRDGDAMYMILRAFYAGNKGFKKVFADGPRPTCRIGLSAC